MLTLNIDIDIGTASVKAGGQEPLGDLVNSYF